MTQASDTNYIDFLRQKAVIAPSHGLHCDTQSLHPRAFPFQRDVTAWALKRGKSALFEECGLGKTLQELMWADAVCNETGGKVVVLTPLAVAHQTVREAQKFGFDSVGFVRDQSECESFRVCVTNYEKLHLFDPSEFEGVVLDESSILKSFTSRTRNDIIEAFLYTRFKLAATATPAPNDYTEIGNHAEFLGIMSRTEMLAEYFVHDGGSTSAWRLKGHAEELFWKWVTSWAVTLRSPADIGHDETRYALPPLCFHHHILEMENNDGLTLFPVQAETLTEQRRAKRSSLQARVDRCAEIVATDTENPWILWCELNDEGDALEQTIPGSVQIAGADSDAHKEKTMIGFAEGSVRVVITKSSIAGFGMNWQHCANVVFAGISHSYEQTYQAIRRCWRFGQERPVQCHFVLSDAEAPILRNLQRKEAEAQRMQAAMVSVMQSVAQWQTVSAFRETNEYAPNTRIQIPSWVRSS